MDTVLQWWVWLALRVACSDHSFQSDVTAIVFVVSCSSFDTVIREDGKTVSLVVLPGKVPFDIF